MFSMGYGVLPPPPSRLVSIAHPLGETDWILASIVRIKAALFPTRWKRAVWVEY
jgi:hypothetical protein